MKQRHPEVFSRISWGTSKVTRETLDRARNSNLSVKCGREIWDVDEIEDFLNGDNESGSYGRNGPDGIKDTNDDTPIDVNLLIDELIRLGAPSPEQLTGRFTASGNTLRIISTGIKGEYQRKLEVVLRNRGTSPSIISREEIFGN